jgi:hypothetical protein
MNTTSSILRCVASMMAITASAGTVAAQDFGPGRANSPSILEGTWQVTIHPYSCATGVPLPTFIRAVHTFTAGGTMIEASSGLNFQPGQRGPGLGFWERTGQRSYRAVFEAYVLFDSPSSAPQPQYKKGRQRFDQGIEIQDPDHWTSDALVTFQDTAGAVVPPSNCATVSAERMK